MGLPGERPNETSVLPEANKSQFAGYSEDRSEHMVADMVTNLGRSGVNWQELFVLEGQSTAFEAEEAILQEALSKVDSPEALDTFEKDGLERIKDLRVHLQRRFRQCPI